jgi:hypothetical protein
VKGKEKEENEDEVVAKTGEHREVESWKGKVEKYGFIPLIF